MNFKNCQKHAVMWVVVCARCTSKSRKNTEQQGNMGILSAAAENMLVFPFASVVVLLPDLKMACVYMF